MRVVSLNAVQVRLAVVAADGVEEITEYSHAHAASSFGHGRHKFPFACLRVVAFNGRDGISGTPAAHGEEDLSPPDGFSRPRPRALHEGTLLREEQVVLGFVHQVPASFVALDEEVRADRAHEEFWTEEREPDVLQDLR